MPPIDLSSLKCPSKTLGSPQFPNPIAVGQINAVKLLDPNESRKEFIIQNTGTTILAIKFGSAPNYNSGDFHILLSAGAATRDGTAGSLVDDSWQGSVWIVSNQSGGECVLTEKI